MLNSTKAALLGACANMFSRVTALCNRAGFFLVRKFFWRGRKPRYIILLGPPGAGKGTLATQLAPAIDLRHLSTGDVFRREKANNTRFGKQVKAHLADGTLVPDPLTLSIVSQELHRPRYWFGAILDGFPRTVTQAEQLALMLESWGASVEFVVLLDVDELDLIDRLSNRLTCTNKACGRSYNLKSERTREAGICDVCHAVVAQRPDDVPEVISARLQTYRTETQPLCNYYQDRGVLVSVKPTAGMTKQEVFAKVKTALRG